MSKLVACKACGKDIAKGVKKCPSCGKDQRSWFGRHKILTFIGGIVIVGSIMGALGGGDTETASTTTSASSSSSSSSSTPAKKEETTYKVGDVIKTDELEVSVTKFEEKDQVGNQYINKKAPEGGVFVAVQYTMKNITDEPIGVFNIPSVNLVDAKGTKYEEDIDASGNYAVETDIDTAKLLSDLNPDIQTTGTGVYEISKAKLGEGEWFIQIGDAKVKIK
jgi:Domain of unknown function (DUF4352)